MAAPWPLVGRQGEMADLREALAGRGAVLVGPAGVGKSSLLRWCGEVAGSEGRPVVWARGSPAARGITLGAFAHLVRGEEAASREELLASTLGRIADGAGARRTVVVVDDAHLLDDVSAALVDVLCTQSAVTTLLAARSDDPVAPQITHLWKDDTLTRIDVRPLDRRDVDDFVRSVLGDGVPISLSERVWHLSRGNPLFVKELLSLADERRDQGGDLIRLNRDHEFSRLRTLVEERLRLLDEDHRYAFELVALGEEVPAAVLDRLVEPSVIEILEGRDLVAGIGAGRSLAYEVSHPIHAEVVKAALPRAGVRARFARLAEAGSAVEGIDPLRLLLWRIESGQHGDAGSLVESALEAASRFDHHLAERLARDAVGLGSTRARIVLGEALAGQGKTADAEAVYDQIEAEDAEEAAQLAVVRARNLFFGLGRPEDALAVLVDAEQAIEEDGWRLECTSMRAQLLLYCVRRDEALAVAEHVAGHPAARPSARVRAVTAAVPLWSSLGHSERALSVGDEWFERARSCRGEVPYGELQLRMVRALALVWSGRLVEADRYARGDIGVSVRWAPAPLLGILESLKGGTALARGRAWEAVGRLQSATRAFEEGDWFALGPWAYAFLARAAVFVGDLATARRALGSALDAQAADPMRTAFALPDIQMSSAWLAAAEGRRSEAVERLVALATLLEPLHRPLAAEAFHTAARLGAADDEIAARVESLAAACDSDLIGALAADVRARLEGEAPLLDAAALRLERVGADLLAADSYRRAAVTYREQGRGASASAADRAAEVLLDRCGQPSPPGLLASVVPVEQLTEREHEVAVLAAEGLSSAEIAERLFLSVRTVDTHLHRVYRKLSIGGRQDLPGVIGVRPAPNT